MYISGNTCLIKGEIFETMTATEFYHFCQENEDLSFERDENGNIIFMPPTGSSTGKLNNTISSELYFWNKQHTSGVTFDSSAGFTLIDGSQRSPDAAWMSHAKWNNLTEAEQAVFAPACPEFIVELRSKSDRINYLHTKMQMWIRNGAHLAWLIDPFEEKAYVYRKDASVDVINSFDTTLIGEEVLKGFELNLSLLKIANP